MMKRNHGNGGSCIKTLLRDMKNAAVEGGATMEMIYFGDFARTDSALFLRHGKFALLQG